MIFDYQASCISRVGKVREKNEDNFLFDGKICLCKTQNLKSSIYTEGTTKNPQIFALFDGIGGTEGGEVAAFTAAETLRQQTLLLDKNVISPKQFLKDAVTQMNFYVYQKGHETGAPHCGTTSVVIYAMLDQLYICNVGDSRIYRFSSDRLCQLSEDDVIKNPAHKNQLLSQYIGVNPEQYSLNAHIKKGALYNDHLFLMCTDGLYNTVAEEEIISIIKTNKNNLTLCAEILADTAEKNGGGDNCTVILIRFRRRSWLANFIRNT